LRLLVDIALTARDPNCGGYNFAWDGNGDVIFDDTESTRSCRASSSSAGTHGSQLYTLRTLSRATPSLAEAFANEALRPLLDARRIVAFTPRARANVQGRLDSPWQQAALRANRAIGGCAR
jgi:phage gp46-like protein